MSDSEKPQGYLPRIVDQQIEDYLRIFGAVEVTGTKWCGKTWASLMHAKSVSYVDENHALAKADPSMMLLGGEAACRRRMAGSSRTMGPCSTRGWQVPGYARRLHLDRIVDSCAREELG